MFIIYYYYFIRLIFIMLMLALLFSFSECAQSQMPSVNITKQEISVPWKPDGNITAGKYPRNAVFEALAGNMTMEVYWKNDPQYLYRTLWASCVRYIPWRNL